MSIQWDETFYKLANFKPDFLEIHGLSKKLYDPESGDVIWNWKALTNMFVNDKRLHWMVRAIDLYIWLSK